MIINTKRLKELLELSMDFVAKHRTLPVLENILIEVNDTELKITASNMEKYIIIKEKIDKTDGFKTTVNLKNLLSIVKLLNNDIEINIDDKENLIIKSGKDKFKLKTIDANEFVAIPNVDGKKIRLKSQNLLDGLILVDFCISNRSFSPALTGALIKQEGEYLKFCGTDSFRLSEYKFKNKGEEFDILLPKQAINPIKKVLNYIGSEEIELNITENLISIIIKKEGFELEMFFILINATFPEYERIIPIDFNHTFTANTKKLLDGINKITLYTKQDNSFVEFNLNGELILKSGEKESGEAKSVVELSNSKGEIRFGINGQFLMEYMNVTKEKDIIVDIIDESNAIKVTSGIEGLTYIVRPLVG